MLPPTKQACACSCSSEMRNTCFNLDERAVPTLSSPQHSESSSQVAKGQKSREPTQQHNTHARGKSHAAATAAGNKFLRLSKRRSLVKNESLISLFRCGWCFVVEGCAAFAKHKSPWDLWLNFMHKVLTLLLKIIIICFIKKNNLFVLY